MALNLEKFLLRFIDEAKDHLQQLSTGIAELEQSPADTELVNRLFRSAHTLKGSSRMLKLEPVSTTAHCLEELLSALRDGNLSFDLRHHPPLLYEVVDALSSQVEHLARTRDPAQLDAADARLCAALEQAARQGTTDPVATPPPPVRQPVPPAEAPTDPALKTSDTVRVHRQRLDELINLMGEVVAGQNRLRHLQKDARQLVSGDDLPAPWNGFIRDFRETVQAQELLVEELHDRALQLRMLPLGTLFDSVGHTVRDMARALGKQIDCKVTGAQIELDRQMIDQLADPLIHLLRNALDHGIEPPAERIEQNKPERGTIHLRAWQDGSWVVLEISDDGRGISLEAVRAKALSKNLVTAEQLDSMSDQETIGLIFTPGFSTSSLITDMSGRGVGMDVVKNTVEDRLQGQVSVHTRAGQGSGFQLRLPLSLAVMRVLLFAAAGQELGVTAQYISELIRIPREELLQFADRRVIRLRNEFVPVLDLAELIDLPARKKAASSPKKDNLLLIAQVRHEKLALIIDELLDERDLVIKQLPDHLRNRPLICGMVTGGRGQLISLLHVPQLLDLARRTRSAPADRDPALQTSKRVLVVDDSLNTREIERDMLEAWGYQVALAEDGQEGLDRALAEDFDAVLTDVEMPVMDGFTLTAQLRQHERYHTRPIIIISSRQKESDRRRGVEVGADAYIVKGDFEQNNLRETLQILLG